MADHRQYYKIKKGPFTLTRDIAANQLLDYAKKEHDKHFGQEETATTTSGNPIPYNNASLTIGRKGPTLFQDYLLFEELAQFSRERIPERVVHAKGSGAFGYFEVTDPDIINYSAAKVFSEVGKRTPIAVRFSQVFGEMGYADTVRDVRGFAIKFRTDDGIWDLVGNNTPIFFIRDAILFPSFIHILKRNPQTHLRDWDMFWDFMTLRPETVHQLLIFFSDRGIPASYRQMNGYGSNTFALVNEFNKFFYCKFHYLTDQHIANLSTQRGNEIAGVDPDYLLRDLYNNIAQGNYPTWTFYVQVMTPEQALKYQYDPFDVTKVWLHADYPLIRVGKLVLHKNPENYFAEVEQLAFDPAHLVPGIEPSPDRMLQGRLFNYGDTHRYRIGANAEQLPVNRASKVRSYAKDGRMNFYGDGGAPNYHPNSFGGPGNSDEARKLAPVLGLQGNGARYDNGNQDNFSQGRLLYQRVLKSEERERLIQNIADTLRLANDQLQDRVATMFGQVDDDLGRRIRDATFAASQKSSGIQHVSTLHTDL